MTQIDPELGISVNRMLEEKNLQNPVDIDTFRATHDFQEDTLKECFQSVHNCLGLSTGHKSTVDTPHRLAKMYRDEVMWGLDPEYFPKATVSPNDSGTNEMILVRNIEVKSLCEHHWQPIIGRCHIAYLPGENLLGLSKFNRIVEYFSRRPQLQERLTEQILATLVYILNTQDVAVILEAEHFCVKFRGVEDDCSDTVTSRMSGRFMSNEAARAELLSLIALGK